MFTHCLVDLVSCPARWSLFYWSLDFIWTACPRISVDGDVGDVDNVDDVDVDDVDDDNDDGDVDAGDDDGDVDDDDDFDGIDDIKERTWQYGGGAG